MNFLKDMFHGLCMACADSVPGVSGGTVAFLMGFYERFIGSISTLVFGKKEEKLPALLYLLRLFAGWVIGFGACAILISKLFSSNIYIMSSLFIGFTIAAIPVVILEEKESCKKFWFVPFFVIGFAIVFCASYFRPNSSFSSINLEVPNALTFLIVFLAGFIAITAMILPGISGSTLLLIMGLYLPVINSVKELLHLNFKPLPSIIFFALGILIGISTTSHFLKKLLQTHRAQIIYLVLGLMTGSLYAIYKGPETLKEPQPALSFQTFNIIAFLLGIAVIVLMYIAKIKAQKNQTKTEEN